MKKALLSALAVLSSVSCVFAETYEIDAVHSSVGFKIRHMVVSKTHGKFKDFAGTVVYDPKASPKDWKVEAVIQTASIDTEDAKRDAHLKAVDFFDVENYPTITFKSGKVERLKGDKAKVHGDLTMHGVTKPVVLDMEMHGAMGGIAGFSASTKIDRMEFGITWNRVMDTGGVALGKEVEIEIEIEAHAKKPEK